MPDYLMINHAVEDSTGWDEFFQMLTDGGHLRGGSALGQGLAMREEVCSAAESKSIVGYMTIRAETLDAAKEIMRQNPIHRAGGLVELFPLVKTD